MPNHASANAETQGNKKTSRAKRSNTNDLSLLLERSQSKLYQTQMLHIACDLSSIGEPSIIELAG